MVDVLQAHEGHGTVRGGVGHRQRGGITGSHLPGSAGNADGGRDHRRRGVNPEDPVTEPGQVTREPAFPASDVQSQPSRRGNQREECLAVETPVAVMARRAGP
jgi:hypothetical protein